MTDDALKPSSPDEDFVKTRQTSGAAQRALEEAALRRQVESTASPPKEINGREGPEPTRYGDWERNGLASDF